MSYNIIEIMNNIIKSVETEHRAEFLTQLIRESDIKGIAAFGQFLYDQEFANNRLDNKCSNPSKIILNQDDLEKTEKQFYDLCVRNVRNYNPVREESGWATLSMIKIIGTNGVDNYLSSLFEEDDNIIYYLRFMVSHTLGHEEGYGFENTEYEYFTEERLIDVIEQKINNNDILKFEDEIQVIVAAYQIWTEREDEEKKKDVYVSEAKARIKKWNMN